MEISRLSIDRYLFTLHLMHPKLYKERSILNWRTLHVFFYIISQREIEIENFTLRIMYLYGFTMAISLCIYGYTNMH